MLDSIKVFEKPGGQRVQVQAELRWGQHGWMGGRRAALGKSESKIALDGMCTEPAARSHGNKCSICFGVGVNSETSNSTTTKVLFL